jgi:DNA modification methylase
MPTRARQFRASLKKKWIGSALREESTLHQISPYIGKMKSSMAQALILSFTRKGDILYDPFCGSGTVALEAWASGRNIIANDLSPYAVVLSRAKLFPHLSVEDAVEEIEAVAQQVLSLIPTVDSRRIPRWVRSFFHPRTLHEIVAWFQVLKSTRSDFILSCLLGILHHQRPGFLSYPSSHTIPYLREKKFPRDLYPELYLYRGVEERLKKKVKRALRRIPDLDPEISRKSYRRNAATFVPKKRVDAIITSPPYMRQLDYGRDNRLRLWFLGTEDWRSMDQVISPSEVQFVRLFGTCLKLWRGVLKPRGLCVLVLGDIYNRSYNLSLPDLVVHIATQEIGGYSVVWKYTEPIPSNRRVRRGCCGSLTETILVLSNNTGN